MINIKCAIILFTLFTTTFGQTRASADDLYLVVGSTREGGKLVPRLAEKFGSDVDFSHTKTFDGRATSLDHCHTSRKDLAHIQADVVHFRPQENQVIRAVFMELLPSIAVPKDQVDFFSMPAANRENGIMQLSFMPDGIRNLAKHMQKGATLDIEHDPYHTWIEDMCIFEKAKTQLISLNPFHGFLPPLFMETIETCYLAKTDRDEYWSALHGRLTKKGYPQAIIGKSIESCIHNLKSTKSALSSIQKSLDLSETEMQLLIHEDMNNYKRFGYRPDLFQIVLLVMSDFIMFSQEQSMKDFLIEAGFKDVTVNIVDKNPYNGRKNSWIISCVKG